jgi:hypothetical protein
VCICSIRYPTYNAHAPYFYLWPVPIYNIFLYYLINGTIFWRKKIIGHKMCFDFLIKFMCNISHSTRYSHKCRDVFRYSTRYYCQKLENSLKIFDEYSNIKFHKNLSSRSRGIPCRRTDRQTWRNWQSLYCNSADAPKSAKFLRRPYLKNRPQGLPEISKIYAVKTPVTFVYRGNFRKGNIRLYILQLTRVLGPPKAFEGCGTLALLWRPTA